MTSDFSTTSSLASAFKDGSQRHYPPIHQLSFMLGGTFQCAQAGIFGVGQGPSSDVHPRHYGQDCGNPIHFRWVLDTSCKPISFCPRSASTRSALWSPGRYVPTDRKRRCGAARIRDPPKAPTKTVSHPTTAPPFAMRYFSLTLRTEGRRGLFTFAVLVGDGSNSANPFPTTSLAIAKKKKKSGILRWTIAGRSHGSTGSATLNAFSVPTEVVHSPLNIRTTKSSVA